jgi:hypothetical protein
LTIDVHPDPATCASTFTVATRPNTAQKTYSLVITGVSGSLRHMKRVSLTVMK